MSTIGAPPSVRAEEWFRILVEQAADGIFIASPDGGGYVLVNASGNRMLGYEPGELVGKPIATLLRTEDLGRLERILGALMRGEHRIEEWTLLRKDGSPVEVEITAQRLGDGSLMAIARDLAPRRAAEAALRRSQEQSRSILQTAPDVIMAVDRQGMIQFINRTVPPLQPEHVVGTCCFDYVPAESRWRVEAALEHVFTLRTIDAYEIQGPPDASGVRGWQSVRVGPLAEGDRVVAAILCATDVSARRQDEERIRHLASQLQRISRQIPGVVFQHQQTAAGQSGFPYVSDRVRDLFGVSAKEASADPLKIYMLIHPDDRERVAASNAESARTLRPRHDEYRIRLPDGNVRWVESNAVPELEADGSIVWSGYVHDVTSRKEAEHQRAQLEEHLRQVQKVESIGKLAGGVAHDFNNLLTSVMGYVGLARGEVADDSEVASYLAGVQEAAERGAALTQQLLAFARKKLVRPEAIYLNDALGRLTGMLRRLVGEDLELVLSLASDAGVVSVDVGSLEQVIMNLVVNARDAIRGIGRITLETRNVLLDDDYSRTHPEVMPGEYVALDVTDTGAGMSPEVMGRLFEPFFTTKPVGQGTGLGLAMCHGIVRQAGGTITVESTPGSGSTFHVYLPRAPASRVPTSATRGGPSGALGPSSQGRETILLVEDEPMILRVAFTALTALGYRVVTATDGVHALEVVKDMTERVQLVISDVVMPRMGGPELVAQLQAKWPHIRVLFSSGYTESSIVERGGALVEGIHFLQKPYTPTILARRVREVLDS